MLWILKMMDISMPEHQTARRTLVPLITTHETADPTLRKAVPNRDSK
jgi:hypothetical protein